MGHRPTGRILWKTSIVYENDEVIHQFPWDRADPSMPNTVSVMGQTALVDHTKSGAFVYSLLSMKTGNLLANLASYPATWTQQYVWGMTRNEVIFKNGSYVAADSLVTGRKLWHVDEHLVATYPSAGVNVFRNNQNHLIGQNFSTGTQLWTTPVAVALCGLTTTGLLAVATTQTDSDKSAQRSPGLIQRPELFNVRLPV
jgi:hypothetical protein